jgi:hypothetical protein
VATVVQGARATNAGIASSRLKVDMGGLYKLEDDQGAMFVTASMLGKEKAGNYEIKWHTTEIRPKVVTVNDADLQAGETTLTVDEANHLQIGDLLIVPSTGETLLVTAIPTSTTATITRSWGTVAAAAIPDNEELLILGPHYSEGASLQDARSVTESVHTNNVALWRNNFKITGTLQAIGEQGGTYHGNDVQLQRENMLLEHKRDINLSCLFSELGSSGTRRSMKGAVEFINGGSGRTDSTSAVTFSVFMTNSQSMTRYNGRKMVGIVSRQFATIVSSWALASSATIHVQPGAKMFGLQVMDITTPHGQFRLLVDDALEGATYKKYGIFLSTDKQGGPRWRYLRDTRMLKDRQEDDEDAYEEEVLTEGTIEWGNPQYHYMYKNAQTAS